MDLKERTRIGIMGPSRCSDGVYELAREVGALVARAGAILICGGGTGVMEAAARGARENGGVTIGILPGESAAEANADIDIPIVTGLGNARNVINVLTSHVIIAIQGGPGTLSEIALALKCGTPVIGLRTWRLEPPEESPIPIMSRAESAEEAVASAIRLARKP